MFWSVVAIVFSTLMDLFNLRGLSSNKKDLEILILQHQLDILERKQTHPIRLSMAEKLTLSVLTSKLKTVSDKPTSQLQNVIRIFQPETVLSYNEMSRPYQGLDQQTLVPRKHVPYSGQVKKHKVLDSSSN